MEYKTVGNLKIPQNLSPEKQAIVDEIARNYAAKNREIDKDNLKNMGRIALGSLVSGASFHPILNIPYVGTGLGGAMYDAGQAIVEGDNLGDIAKRAGRGFAIGETVGAIPYVGKAAAKTKAGQAVVKKLDKVGEKVAQNPAVQKAYDVLMTDIKALNPNKQTVYHGSPYDFEKFSNEAIGTGEGAQAHGIGHYTALDKDVAEGYRNRLSTTTAEENLIKQYGKERVIDDLQNNLNDSLQELQALQKAKLEQAKVKDFGRRKPIDYDNSIKLVEEEINNLQNRIYNINNPQISGQLYKLSVPKDDVMLREDLPFSQQPKAVQDALKKLGNTYNDLFDNSEIKTNIEFFPNSTKGKEFYASLMRDLGDEKVVAEELYDNGIKGISYNGGIDGEARVIFNPDDIDIVRKYYNQPTLKDIYNKFINSGTFAGALTNP